MATAIVKNEDGTINVEWTGRAGRGSLYQVMASSNAEYVNALTYDDLVLVIELARSCPFPALAGGYDGVAKSMHAKMLDEANDTHKIIAAIRDAMSKRVSLADLREYVIGKAGDGCNAPHDSYLREVFRAKHGSDANPSDYIVAAEVVMEGEQDMFDGAGITVA